MMFITSALEVFTAVSAINVEGSIDCLNHAHGILAYLDPGTGSMIFQLLIAGLVAGSFAIKIFWGRIKAFFSHLFTKISQKTIAKENDQKK